MTLHRRIYFDANNLMISEHNFTKALLHRSNPSQGSTRLRIEDLGFLGLTDHGPEKKGLVGFRV